MENLIKSLGRAFWKSLYPPHCLHCERYLHDGKVFCGQCQLLLELIDPHGRCRYCFTGDGVSPKWKICGSCRKKSHPLQGYGAAFENLGPARDLIQQFRSGRSYLSDSLGSFLFLQFNRLGWSVPDMIIPVAGSLSQWLRRGYHPASLLAKEMGVFLNCPVSDNLRRNSYHTEEPQFRLKRSQTYRDKTVLLIDDGAGYSRTIEMAAQTIRSEMPAKIYAMNTVC